LDLDTRLSIPELTDEAATLVLDSFDHETAWQLGSLLRARAAAERYPVAIDIRRATGAILFRAALPGATADQEDWIRRKCALAFRFESSSALLTARLAEAGVDPVAMGWLPTAEYALSGGAVPIRVEGAGIVAMLTVSGLSADADHRFAAQAIRDIRDGSA
jgi:uncharacterized protein (UPF0303 family)